MLRRITAILPILPAGVLAHCPLCTAATGSLVAVTRLAGVDDTVVGTFIGAFTISTALWASRMISKRLRRSFPFQSALLSVLSLALTLGGFYLGGVLNTSSLQLFGIDRLLFGTVLGAALTIVALEVHKAIRKGNGNKNHLPFQGILLPLAILAVANAALYVFGILL